MPIKGALTASAPLRVCLCGEDLDWLGPYPTLCVAVEPHTVVTTDPRASRLSSPMIDAAWERIGASRHGGSQPVLGSIAGAYVGAGLASSTSMLMAAARVLARSAHRRTSIDELIESTYEIELGFYNGGGMDHIAIGHGGVTLSRGSGEGLGTVERRPRWPPRWRIGLVDLDLPKDTSEHIRDVRTQAALGSVRLDGYVGRVAPLAPAGARAVDDADLAVLHDVMTTAHDAMHTFQCMSLPRLELAREVVRRHGIEGVKLTGAGGGGALAFVFDESETDRVAALPARLTGSLPALHPDLAVVDVSEEGLRDVDDVDPGQGGSG